MAREDEIRLRHMMARLLIQQVLTRIEEFALVEVMSGSAG